MVRSPEQYLSEMDFSAPGASAAKPTFNASERAFVEKYLGLDTFEKLPVITPGGASRAPKPVKTLERPRKIETQAPEIVVAKPAAPVSAPHVSQEAAPGQPRQSPQPQEQQPPRATTATPIQQPARPAPLPTQVSPEPAAPSPQLARPAPVAAPVLTSPVPPAPRVSIKAQEEAEIQPIIKRADLPPPGQKVASPEPAPQKPAPLEDKIPTAQADENRIETSVQPGREAASAQAQRQTRPAEATAPAAQAQQVDLREQLKQEKEIQIVSFLVAGQIFLLPVAGIQEVLRYQELVKVPQAPDFVAGVINLRGRVTPLVHLTALLTNAQPAYDEKNFIIICGGEGLQLGLIIDRISGMHVLPQNKIIWNAEAKLGESAEFLSAIADLDDKVCGIVAPEAITRKILAK